MSLSPCDNYLREKKFHKIKNKLFKNVILLLKAIVKEEAFLVNIPVIPHLVNKCHPLR